MEGELFKSINIRDAADRASRVGAASLRAAALAATQQRRAQSDASRNIAGARRRGCACARKGGIAAGRPGGPVVVVGHGRGAGDGDGRISGGRGG